MKYVGQNIALLVTSMLNIFLDGLILTDSGRF